MDLALLAWSGAVLRQQKMVEAVVQLLDTATMARTQTVDLANLMWAIAHTDVRVAPALLLSFSVSCQA